MSTDLEPKGVPNNVVVLWRRITQHRYLTSYADELCNTIADLLRENTELTARNARLREASDAVIEWWMREGIVKMYRAPACIFMIKEALAELPVQSLEAIRAEATRPYRQLCAEVYQIIGALDGPVNALDNLSDAANGDPLRHDCLLPYEPPDQSVIRAEAISAVIESLKGYPEAKGDPGIYKEVARLSLEAIEQTADLIRAEAKAEERKACANIAEIHSNHASAYMIRARGDAGE